MKKIFISSPFSLCRERVGLAKMIRQTFKWDVFLFEWDDVSLLPSLPACLDAVEKCDYCLVLFGTRYGSLLDTEPISYTIREFWRALAQRKPTRVYIWKPLHGAPQGSKQPKSQQREPALAAALLAIEDADIGPARGYFKSLAELKQKVATALREWAASGFPHGPGLYIGYVLKGEFSCGHHAPAVVPPFINPEVEIQDLRVAAELVRQIQGGFV